MNLLQRVVHRKSFGRNSKERPATSPYSNPWGEGAPGESDIIILSGSPHGSPVGEIPPPLPTHCSPTSEQKSFFHRPNSNGALQRSSAISHRRQSTLGLGDEEDEDVKLMRDSVEALRRLGANDSSSPQLTLPSVRQQPLLSSDDSNNHESAQLMHDTTNALGGHTVDDMPRARQSWLMPSTVSSYNPEGSKPPPVEKDSSFVVRPRYPATEPKEDNLFDSAQIASQFAEAPPRPDAAPKAKGKVMTTAQFEKYRQEQERLKSIGYKSKAESAVDDEEDNYEDEDEDEDEKRREQARQRRKQEAHMTVYRQQMMKITGDVMAAPQRPGIAATQSTPNLSLDNNVVDPEDEDEDIPLAILQAHGFPNRNRAPGQLNGMSSNPNLRGSGLAASNGTGSVNGAGSRASVLPAFARRLPQDPYNYSAGIVNPTNRESLAFGSGSQYGGGQRPVAGGLVGVIANEERSRAMRRGSPNTQGEYPAMPANMMGPPTRQSMMPGMNGMPYSADPAIMQAQMAQMQAQLQQSMEMQMQFFNMVTGAPPPPMQGMPGTQGSGSVYGMPPTQAPFTRASTMGNMQGMNSNFLGVDKNSRPGSAQNGRPYTVADPNFASLGGSMRNSFMPMGGNGYAASITPSERSNVGQPGRYRPVSHMPQSNMEPSRTSTMMSGGTGGWNNSRTTLNGSAKASTPTVRILPIEKEAEDDEERGWEEMRQKQAKKKSMWRSRKQDNDLGDVAHFTN